MKQDTIWEPIRNDVKSVGTSSVVVVPSNPNRKSIIIKNTSSADAKIITLNLGSSQAVANQGIVLYMRDAWSDSDDSGYNCFKGEITAICAAADGQLSVMER